MIASATVAGCSERRHFVLNRRQMRPFLGRCRCVHAASFVRSHSDLNLNRRRDGELSPDTTRGIPKQNSKPLNYEAL